MRIVDWPNLTNRKEPEMPNGNNVVWTIVGVLLTIALIVWLIPHVR